MRGKVQMTVSELVVVLGTRAGLGVGLGLLLANQITTSGTRRAVASTLLLTGALLGASLALELFVLPRPFTLTFGQGDGSALNEKFF